MQACERWTKEGGGEGETKRAGQTERLKQRWIDSVTVPIMTDTHRMLKTNE